MTGIQVFLDNPIEYHTEDGEVETSCMLAIHAPRPCDDAIRTKLKAMYLRAMRAQAMGSVDIKEISNERLIELQEADKKREEEEKAKRAKMTPSEIADADKQDAKENVQLIYSIPEDNFDILKFRELFEEMVTVEKPGPLVLVDGKVGLKQSYLKSMESDDRDLLLGYYMQNFMIPCWTN